MAGEKRLNGDDSSEEDEPIGPRPSIPSNASRQNGEGKKSSSQISAPVKETPKSEKFQRNWEAVEADQWNTDAWVALMTEVQELPIEEARFYYDKFFELYPTSGRWWKAYAEHELQNQNFDQVQTILQKSLNELRCPHIDLWRFYLSFTRVVTVDVAAQNQQSSTTPSQPAPTSLPEAHHLMCEAFERAIDRIGLSIHAAPIWQDYVTFLMEDTTGQYLPATRKVFHRALSLPMHNMDQLWRDYEKFERSIPNNEVLAQNSFKALRPKFDAARAVFKDRKKLMEGINLSALPVPFSALDIEKETLVARNEDLPQWQKLWKFELTNPERLDAPGLQKRLRFTMELMVSCKRQYPEIWYQFARFEMDSEDLEAANEVFERSRVAVPNSSLLSFAWADFLEQHQQDKDAAKQVYERLLEENPSALAYIAYQRFARRAYGIKASRDVFKRARKDERDGVATYHVYVAAALLEYFSDRSDAGKVVALKIFELALSKFIENADFAVCYLDFLSHTHDETNLRASFEKVLAVMPTDKSRPIWDRYVDFEHKLALNGGDLAAVSKVEKRRAEAFPDSPYVETQGLLSVAHRYSFLDLTSPDTEDQSFFSMYRRSVEAPSAASISTTGAASSVLFASGATAKQGSGPLADADDAQASGLNSTADGGFQISEKQIPGPPLPDFLKEFATMLPLNLPWNGPIADVEHIYRTMLLVDFPPRSQIERLAEQQEQQQQQQQLAQQHIQQLQKQDGTGMNDGDDVEGVVSKRPAHDVFRSRQKQKLAKLG